MKIFFEMECRQNNFTKGIKMMWLQRKTNFKITVTFETILKIINNLLYY